MWHNVWFGSHYRIIGNLEIIISMTSPMGIETTGRSVLSVTQMPWFEIHGGKAFCFIDQEKKYIYIYSIYMKERGRIWVTLHQTVA